ncbi:MAG: aspartyl protease family protein [Vulcanisaeta sp.]|nr:aspartyl protease family protein [Vulcanisaeta sp.]
MSRDVRMLVDTGSTYIVLDQKTIEELGLVETPYAVDLVLADGRRVRAKLFLAEVEVKGRRGPAFVAELNVPTPLLGVYALETLGFKVNPRTGELEEVSPEGGYLLYLCLVPPHASDLNHPSSSIGPCPILG